MLNPKLKSKDKLTSLINNIGIKTWDELMDFVRLLPYGRNSNRTDFNLVITERKGTCSSKHALLKKVAILNNIPNIRLILGIYKMNKNNTPKIGNILIENKIEHILEAHCYLKINGKRIDLTTFNSGFEKIELDLIQEIEIEAEQVVQFKIKYHQSFLKKWILENNLKFNFDELWLIREQCINNMTK